MYLLRGYSLCFAFAAILVTQTLVAQDGASIIKKEAGSSAPVADKEKGAARPAGGPGRMGPPEAFPEARAIPQPKNEEELAAAIKKLAGELAMAGRFSGSILLAVEGKKLVDEAWGTANRAEKIANTPETAYDVGSIGKLFTQIALLQLEEAGKLKLDDPLGKSLPDYPNREVATKVTLDQLLRHRSGIADIFAHVTPEMKLNSRRDLKDFLPLFTEQPLDFAPGSSERYSSSGYIVLGLVIEALTGENYFTYIEKHILKPAGMAQSGFFDREQLPQTVAHSYDEGQDVSAMHPPRGTPAGGLQASAGDLLRLVQTLDAGTLLQPESVKVLRDLIPRPPDLSAPPIEKRFVAYGIQGGAPGVSAQLVIDLTGRYTRAILCNDSPPMSMMMGTTIREWIAQLPK
ncbi:MAG: serine hydrolase domain-containing protein [Chthoniobacterales bacterium]